MKSQFPNITHKIFLCAFFVCIGLLVLTPSVFAETGGGNSLDQTMRDLVNILQPILKLIYILMRPLLVIAGSALDNTFVYGEFIRLDSVLRQIRQITKNFANFALGFFVLKSIGEYFFGFKSLEDAKGPKKIITNAILAGVLIQASWFLIGIIIDISTIATYAIGGLPMTLIQQTKLGEKPVLGIRSFMDLSSVKKKGELDDSFSYYYTRGDANFAPCMVYKGFVIGRMYNEIANEKGKNIRIDPQRCVYNSSQMVRIATISYGDDKKPKVNTSDRKNGILYYAKKIHITDDGYVSLMSGTNPVLNTTILEEIKGALDVFLGKVKESGFNANSLTSEVREKLEGIVYMGYINANNETTIKNNKPLLKKNEGKAEDDTPIQNAREHFRNLNIRTLDDMVNSKGIMDWQVVLNTPCSEKQEGFCYYGKGTYLGTLLEDSKGFVGPLVTLYTSLMNLGDLHVTTVGGGGGRTDYATFFEFLLKTITGVLLIFPLFGMTVVLIVRIGYIRILIALSPLVALGGVFKLGTGGSMQETIKKYLPTSVSEFVGLIFSPVIIVFALSVSILFLYTLQDAFHGQQHAIAREGLGIKITQGIGPTDQCMSVWGLFETCYDVGANHYGGSFYLDLFARLVMNMFGIAIVWGILWAAINASKMTTKIAQSVKQLGEKIIQAAPVIPLPGVGMTSAGAINSAFGLSSGGRGELYRHAEQVLDDQTRKDVEKLEDLVIDEDNDKLKRAVLNQDESEFAKSNRYKNYTLNNPETWREFARLTDEKNKGTDHYVNPNEAKKAYAKHVDAMLANPANYDANGLAGFLNTLDDAYSGWELESEQIETVKQQKNSETNAINAKDGKVWYDTTKGIWTTNASSNTAQTEDNLFNEIIKGDTNLEGKNDDDFTVGDRIKIWEKAGNDTSKQRAVKNKFRKVVGQKLQGKVNKDELENEARVRFTAETKDITTEWRNELSSQGIEINEGGQKKKYKLTFDDSNGSLQSVEGIQNTQ